MTWSDKTRLMTLLKSFFNDKNLGIHRKLPHKILHIDSTEPSKFTGTYSIQYVTYLVLK